MTRPCLDVDNLACGEAVDPRAVNALMKPSPVSRNANGAHLCRWPDPRWRKGGEQKLMCYPRAIDPAASNAAVIPGPAMRSLRLAETQDRGSNVATDMKPVNRLAANDILRRRRRVLLQGGVQP